jgi:hypothetical protein
MCCSQLLTFKQFSTKVLERSSPSPQSEQYETERFQRGIYSGFMLDNLTDVNRKIQEKCELMTKEQDGRRIWILADELERLFEQKDLIAVERNRLYRQNYLVPSTTVAF